MATNNTTVNENSSNSVEDYTTFPFPTRTNAITDDYRVSKYCLGTGISGKVLRCQHRTTEQKCALKILVDTPKARREVIMHKKACENCQYIVKVVDVYENEYGPNRCLLIITERQKSSLSYNRPDNPYTERDAARFISMIVQAVAHLHAMDMAHRDLKPENLLLTKKDNEAILKLTDFGFAKEGNNKQQPLSTPCYTAYYVAPEILSGTKYDKACDIWSMGVIMYILLCGYPPFYTDDGSNMSPGMKNRIIAGEYTFQGDNWCHVSEEAKSTIKRMLTVDPGQRITIGEILKCSWLTESTSARPIDTSSLRDAENRNQIQTELASANNQQRRPDDDAPIEIQGPAASRLAKKRAAKKHDAENSNQRPSDEYVCFLCGGCFVNGSL